MTPLLELRGVTKRYGGFRALRGVDLALAHGESVALLGPNGAGKTTLLRIVAGLVRPSGGDVMLEGRPAFAEPQLLRRRLGHVSHHSMLHEALSARENLTFAGRLYDVKQLRTRIDQLLRNLDLVDRGDEPVRQLSRGMQQRVAIARALLHEPDLLLLDEPYTGLDRASGAALTSILASLRRRGCTLLLVTHDPDRALDVAERVVVLRLGRIVAERPSGGMSSADLELLLAGTMTPAEAGGAAS